jgi:YegS/Rv2252/BmrU family lipid kinase
MDSAVGKTVVVVNPQSANGALGRTWRRIDGLLSRALDGHEAVMTRGPRDACRLAREALDGGADTVVAIGGDGTIHEVANGFFEDGKAVRPGARLGIIPFGTGGDFRKTTAIPRRIEDAIAVIRAGHTRVIDVGLLEYRAGDHRGAPASCVFVNIASFGIGGVVDRIVNSSSKRLGGRATFLLATVRAFAAYRNQPVKIVYDGDEASAEEATINNVAVANGRYFGGGMFVAPRAELDDGLFDVVVIGDVSVLEALRESGRLYKGTHIGRPKIHSRRAARVEARPLANGADVFLDIDGEALGALPATFSLLPRARPVLVPAHG